MMITVKKILNSTLFVVLFIVLVTPAGQSRPSPEKPNRSKKTFSQLSLDFGPLHGALSYAGSVSEGGLGLGLGAGFSWEDVGLATEKNIWDVLHGELFLRAHPRSWLYMDLGATVMRYAPSDDSSERGTFFGGYLAPMIGWKWFLIGTHAAMGVASDPEGSDFVVVLRPVVLRLVLRF